MVLARYNTPMNRLRALSLLALSVLPLSAAAAEMPLLSSGWSLVPEACRACPCGFAGVMGTVQNLVNGGISIGVLFAVIIIAWAGFLYITTPANPEARSQANKMLINAAVGLLIVLSAWLIVDFVMKALYSGPDGTKGEFGPWNSILSGGDICVTSFETVPLFSGAITAAQLSTSGGTPGVAGGGPGSCRVATSGACAYTNFVQAFGSETTARQAAQICYAESGGVVQRVSGSDYMHNDPQHRAFSFGLFQINLTYHSVAGLNCPSAFTGKNYTARVKDEALYARCVAAAKTASANIAEAVATNKRTGWTEWSTARQCGLADAGIKQLPLALQTLITRGVSLLP